MPNRSQFRTHEDYLNWYRQYRKQNRNKLRVYGAQYNKQWRKDNGYHNESNWKEHNQYKVKAHRILQYALKKGRLTKKPCKICGDKRTQAHHPDYSKPLVVKWYCATHHKQQHITPCG